MSLITKFKEFLKESKKINENSSRNGANVFVIDVPHGEKFGRIHRRELTSLAEGEGFAHGRFFFYKTDETTVQTTVVVYATYGFEKWEEKFHSNSAFKGYAIGDFIYTAVLPSAMATLDERTNTLYVNIHGTVHSDTEIAEMSLSQFALHYEGKLHKKDVK